MSYLVMARKWRPRNFEEMVGQEHIAQTLRNAIASGRISHAYLFTGTRGVGKTTSARILAKALNCKNGPTATPCEVCENCIAVSQGSSMDVLEIDGASNNSVDNIRDLREQVKYAPMQGTYKVYIIDEVHMLSKAAFNALLKTLEEPPPHVVFIFATTESSKVPHTILSRVQRFDFKRISETGIRERLEYICTQEGITPEREALEAIARKADGSMRDALSLFDRVYAFAGSALTLDLVRKALGIPEERMFDDLLRFVSGHDTAGTFKTLDEVYNQGLEVSEFLSGFGEYLRDLLFSRQPGITPALLGRGDSRFAELRSLGGDLQDGDLLRYAKIVSDLLAGLKSAPHPRLWIELGLARMAALDRVVTLSQLMGQDVPSAHLTGLQAPAGASHASLAPPAPAPAPSPAPSSESEEKKKSPELSPPALVDHFESQVPPSHAAPGEPDEGILGDLEDDSDPREESRAAETSATSDEAPQEPSPPEPHPSHPYSDPSLDTEGAGMGMDPESDLDSPDRDFESGSAADSDYDPRPDASAPGYSPVTPLAFTQGDRGENESGLPPQGIPVESAPRSWPDLVEEYAQDKPFTSGPLRHSQLVLKSQGTGEPPLLEVVFSGPHQHDLFLADGDNRKTLAGFLRGRLVPSEGFGLSYSVDPSAEGTPMHPPESPQALLQQEPILRTLVELFEGRILN